MSATDMSCTDRKPCTPSPVKDFDLYTVSLTTERHAVLYSSLYSANTERTPADYPAYETEHHAPSSFPRYFVASTLSSNISFPTTSSFSPFPYFALPPQISSFLYGSSATSSCVPPLDTPVVADTDAPAPRMTRRRTQNLLLRRENALTDRAIKQTLHRLPVGSRVEVVWSSSDDPAEENWRGTICQINVDGSRGIRYDGQAEQFTLPPTPDILILELSVLSWHGLQGLPPIEHVVRPLTIMPPLVVYFDGGCSPNPGEGGAAFTAFAAGVNVIEHYRYYTYANNIFCEWAAALAALRWIRDQPGDVLLIGDCKTVVDGLTTANRCADAKTKPVWECAKILYAELCTRVNIARMDRNFGNKADPLVHKARALATSTNDTLFPFPTFAAPPARPQPSSLPALAPAAFATLPITVTSADEFAALRRFPVRGRCPPYLLQHWSALVKTQCQRILTATTSADRSTAFVQLLLLPHLFLPARAPLRRIETHLSAQTPFQLDVLAAPSRPPLVPVPPAQRLAAAVTRAANDHRVKAAMKLVQQQDVTSPSRSFEEQRAALLTKIIATAPPVIPSPATCTPVSAAAVLTAVQAQSPNAATCIDGWNRRLLLQAIEVDSTLLDDLAAIVTMLLNNTMGLLPVELLRLGRVVAVPKPNGDIRPIVVSSFFCKVCGSIALRLSGLACSSSQHAVAVPNGAAVAVHKLRQATTAGLNVVKFDISNAFNSTQRQLVHTAIAREADVMRAYFNVFCAPPSSLFLYGPAGVRSAVPFADGLRAGDAASAALFCKTIDEVYTVIRTQLPTVQLVGYMDDLHVICRHNELAPVIAATTAAFAGIGLKINVEKSLVLLHGAQEAPIGCAVKTAHYDRDAFMTLGSNISACFGELTEKLKTRYASFCNLLMQLPLHPQLVFTLLRLSGNPKLVHFCRTTPPAITVPAVGECHKHLEAAFSKLIMATPPAATLYDRLGAGFIDYVRCASQLYDETRHLSQTGSYPTSRVQLVPTLLAPSDVCGGLSGEWLWYDLQSISAADFVTALALRLGVLPASQSFCPAICNCGEPLLRATDAVTHILKCDKATSISHTFRHNLLRDAAVRTARRFGICTSCEPTFYVYDSIARQRPDATFFVHPTPVATDFTIVHPGDTPGAQTALKDAEKIRTHDAAVRKFTHRFIPAACESTGHIGKGLFALRDALSAGLPLYEYKTFSKIFLHACSCALASGRAAVIRSFAEAQQRALGSSLAA